VRALAFAAALLPAGGALAQSACHVTALAGAVRGQSQHLYTSDQPITDRFEVGGGTAGLGAGCDWLYGGTWFSGFDLDLAGADVSGETRAIGEVGPTVTSGTQIDGLATLRARIGRRVSPIWSVYGTAGAGFARATATVKADDGRFFADTQKLYGAALGGGVEAHLTQVLSVRLEYLFFKFAKKSFFDPPPPPVHIKFGGGVDPELHVVRVGLSLNF
jgi:opacity protein-like surface antigen